MQLIYRKKPSPNIKASLKVKDRWESCERIFVSIDIASMPYPLVRYAIDAYNFEFATDFNENNGFAFHIVYDDPAETAFADQFIVMYLMNDFGDLSHIVVRMTEEEFLELV